VRARAHRRAGVAGPGDIAVAIPRLVGARHPDPLLDVRAGARQRHQRRRLDGGGDGRADGQLEETLTVIGPLTVLGGCVSTLTAWAETPAGVPVPTPTPSPSAHCLAIALVVIPAGSSRAFTAVLPDPAQPGTYAIHATLDTQGPAGSPVPVVTVST
jgi:hypothetical protein